MLNDLIRRSFWLSIGAATGRLLPLAVLLLVSREMEIRQFASASAGYAWAGVAMSLTSAGLATVMTQRLAAAASTAAQVRLFRHHLRLSVGWSTLLALVVLVFGERGSGVLFGTAIDPVVVVPAAMSGALWSQVAVCVAALNGCHRARAASLALAACGLLQGTCMAVAVRFIGADAISLTWGLLVGSALACVVVTLLIRRVLAIQGWRSVWGATAHGILAVPLWRSPVLWNTVSAATALPVGFIASSMIAHGADGSRQLAQYFALEQVHQVLVYLPVIVGQALLPLITRRIVRADNGAQRARLLRRLALVASGAALTGLLIGAAMIVDVGWFVRLLGNPALQAYDAWSIRWMVLNAALGLSLSVIGGAFLGAGHIVAAGLLNLAWGTLFLSLTAALSSHGNLGLQTGRFAASACLAMAGALMLLTMAAREMRVNGGHTPNQGESK